MDDKARGMEALGQLYPEIVSPPPGPRCRALVERLARAESPAFTARRARRWEATGAPQDPIVWTHARDCNVLDADQNRYVDLTGGFGVALGGHAHPAVLEAIGRQATSLIHALGDLHPSDVKIALLERLTALAPFEQARVVLSCTGSDAVEVALKTAALATHRPGVLSFEGGYHGLGYGALAVCGYQPAFRRPFAAQTNPHVRFAPWPSRDADPGQALERVAAFLDDDIGAVIVEPIQGRAGVRIPPAGFLRGLGELARARGAVLIADEIFTGLGRTGALFRSVEEGLCPDLLAIGKALGGGMPISACLGRAEVMAAWGAPEGEAIHTGTFFGHPLSCAAALAILDRLTEEDWGSRARTLGARLQQSLEEIDRERIVDVRAVGALVGIELEPPLSALAVCSRLLQQGFLTLPAGAHAETLQLAPPLTMREELMSAFAQALERALRGDE